jgi:hypothetical protein
MNSGAEPRRLRSDDLLYRKVQPGQWDDEGPHPAAFQDKHQDLSLFVARLKSPAQVLSSFAHYPAVMRACGTRRRRPTPAEMYAAGYRIAAIPFHTIAEHGFQVEEDPEGHQYRAGGHVNVLHGKNLAITWARRARLLSREETLG